jgi:hypothetical protein
MKANTGSAMKRNSFWLVSKSRSASTDDFDRVAALDVPEFLVSKHQSSPMVVSRTAPRSQFHGRSRARPPYQS